VIVSVAGEYYELLSQADEDSDDPESPDLILQRQFAIEDSGRRSVETHDENFIGEFILEHIEFTRERLLIGLDPPGDKQIVVIFDLGHSEFETASQALRIISGEINLFD
ncbi:MAG: hypothetical protein ACREEU_05070, partial [Acetobacteraceae bacterium]